jgi:hypothetical protein
MSPPTPCDLNVRKKERSAGLSAISSALAVVRQGGNVTVGTVRQEATAGQPSGAVPSKPHEISRVMVEAEVPGVVCGRGRIQRLNIPRQL